MAEMAIQPRPKLCMLAVYSKALHLLYHNCTRPQLVGIGTDPGLLDRNGRFLSQRDPKGSAWLVDGIFVDEEPGEPVGGASRTS